MDTSSNQILAARVKELREKRGFGERSGLGGKVGFCEMARISRPELDAIEQGKIDVKLSTLDKLARALDVDSSELIRPFE